MVCVIVLSFICVLLQISSTNANWCKDDFCRWKKCNTPLDACRNLPIQTSETERICQADYISCVKECCTKRRRLRRDTEDIQKTSFVKSRKVISTSSDNTKPSQLNNKFNRQFVQKNYDATSAQRALFLSIRKCELNYEFSILKLCPALYYESSHLEQCRSNVKRVCKRNCVRKLNEETFNE